MMAKKIGGINLFPKFVSKAHYMTPLFDRLLVSKEKNKELQVGSGLIVSESAMEVMHERGRVISVGPDVKCVKPGDVVYFIKGSGSPIVDKDKIYHILQQHQLDIVETDETNQQDSSSAS